MNCTAIPNSKPCSREKTDYDHLVKQKYITRQEADFCKAAERKGFDVTINSRLGINSFEAIEGILEIIIEKKRRLNDNILYVASRYKKKKANEVTNG